MRRDLLQGVVDPGLAVRPSRVTARRQSPADVQLEWAVAGAVVADSTPPVAPFNRGYSERGGRIDPVLAGSLRDQLDNRVWGYQTVTP